MNSELSDNRTVTLHMKLWHEAVVRVGLGWTLGKVSSPRRWLGTEQAPQGRGDSTKPAKVQEFDQCSQAQGGIVVVSCAGPGVGLDDPCEFLPAQDVLLFCHSIILCCRR